MEEMVKNINVFGLSESIRGAKFPMSTDVNSLNETLTDGITRLAQSGMGEGHDNFLCGIIAQFDLTLTCKMAIEMERYHFWDIVSSQSTMHRIAKFDLDNSYIEYTDKRIIEIIKEKVKEYNDLQAQIKEVDISGEDINKLTEKAKEKYLEILYSNPNGFLMTMRCSVNYRQLKTVYKQRKNHRLPEWREFCKWVETLPHSELITGNIE